MYVFMCVFELYVCIIDGYTAYMYFLCWGKHLEISVPATGAQELAAAAAGGKAAGAAPVRSG